MVSIKALAWPRAWFGTTRGNRTMEPIVVNGVRHPMTQTIPKSVDLDNRCSRLSAASRVKAVPSPHAASQSNVLGGCRSNSEPAPEPTMTFDKP